MILHMYGKSQTMIIYILLLWSFSMYIIYIYIYIVYPRVNKSHGSIEDFSASRGFSIHFFQACGVEDLEDLKIPWT